METLFDDMAISYSTDLLCDKRVYMAVPLLQGSSYLISTCFSAKCIAINKQ